MVGTRATRRRWASKWVLEAKEHRVSSAALVTLQFTLTTLPWPVLLEVIGVMAAAMRNLGRAAPTHDRHASTSRSIDARSRANRQACTGSFDKPHPPAATR